jgi:polyribonucleotide nucleotidyltransferase
MEMINARLTDRPLRPMLPKGWAVETQVLTWLMSYDNQHQPEPLAITAAGAALAISGHPLISPAHRTFSNTGVARLTLDLKVLLKNKLNMVACSSGKSRQ